MKGTVKNFFAILSMLVFAVSASATYMGPVRPRPGGYDIQVGAERFRRDLEGGRRPSDYEVSRYFLSLNAGIESRLAVNGRIGLARVNTEAGSVEYAASPAAYLALGLQWKAFSARRWDLSLQGGYHYSGSHEPSGPVATNLKSFSYSDWNVGGQVQGSWGRAMPYLGGRYSYVRSDADGVFLNGTTDDRAVDRWGVYGGLTYDFSSQLSVQFEGRAIDEYGVALGLTYHVGRTHDALLSGIPQKPSIVATPQRAVAPTPVSTPMPVSEPAPAPVASPATSSAMRSQFYVWHRGRDFGPLLLGDIQAAYRAGSFRAQDQVRFAGSDEYLLSVEDLAGK